MLQTLSRSLILAAVAAALLTVLPRSTWAAEWPRLDLELHRPDGTPETLQGQLLLDEPTPPQPENIQRCGTGALRLSFRKVTYSSTATQFSYYILVQRSRGSRWEEWVVRRDDVGRFTSKRLPDVKVFSTAAPVADCSDFRLPIYCVSNCSQSGWWKPAAGTPTSLTAHLGPTSFWNLLFDPDIEVDAAIVEPVFTFEEVDSWRTEAQVDPQQKGRLKLQASPKWGRLLTILLQPDELHGQLSFRSDVTDATAENISTNSSVTLPVVIRPVWPLLFLPLLFGVTVGFVTRHLFARIPDLGRDFLLTALVASIAWAFAYATSAKAEVLHKKIDSQAFVGALAIGVMSGLSGKRALKKRVYDLFNLQEPQDGGKGGPRT